MDGRDPPAADKRTPAAAFESSYEVFAETKRFIRCLTRNAGGEPAAKKIAREVFADDILVTKFS